MPVDELVSTVCAQLTPPIAPDGRPKREQEQRNVTIQLHGAAGDRKIETV